MNKNLASRSHVLHLVLQHSSKRKYMVTKCNHFDWRKWRHKPEKIGILQMIIIIDTIDRGQAKKQNIFESTYIYSTSRTKPLFDSKGQRIFFFSGCRLDLSCAFTGYGTLWGLYSLKSELIPLVFFSLYISRKDISEYVLRGGQTTQDCFLKGNCCFNGRRIQLWKLPSVQRVFSGMTGTIWVLPGKSVSICWIKWVFQF